MSADKTNETDNVVAGDAASTGTADTLSTKAYSVSSRDGVIRDTGAKAHLLKSWPHFRVPTVERPNWLGRNIVIVCLVALLAGFSGGWFGANYHSATTFFTSGTLSDQKKVVTSESQLISRIASQVGPSVVSVNVTGTNTAGTDLFGNPIAQPTASAGTGVIISSDGVILTNRHVVPDGTQTVSVTLADGTQFKNVEVLGRTNSSDSLDVAFLKITDTKGKKLTPATIGDSSKVSVGDTVVAIGNALGQFQNTVTSGIISGYGRSVQASSSLNDSAENLDDLFQTDAAINEGNSGGPLVNMNGQVVGLNTAIAGNAQNIGFSIPMNDISGLIKQVMTSGKLARPYLGVRYVLLTDDYAYQYNLSVKRGAYIAPSADGSAAVMPDSPADKAGLREKDVITKIDGTAIDQNHSLISLLGQRQPGDTVTLTVVRDGKTITIKVTLGTAPAA